MTTVASVNANLKTDLQRETIVVIVALAFLRISHNIHHPHSRRWRSRPSINIRHGSGTQKKFASVKPWMRSSYPFGIFTMLISIAEK
jgi:fatty acid desaturase